MSGLGKRTKKAREGVDREKLYPLPEAVKMVKDRAKAKFDETIEVAMNLGIDPRHADQMVRGVVNLPNGSGRSVRVAVFARGAKADEAKAAGADVIGAEDLVEKVQGGNIDFDRVVATPDLMPLVGRLGKVLGPRGLMPNPKVGTVTMDIANAVRGAKGGSVEFRAEKAGVDQPGRYLFDHGPRRKGRTGEPIRERAVGALKRLAKAPWCVSKDAMGVPARFVGAPLCAFPNTIQARPLLSFRLGLPKKSRSLTASKKALLSKTAGAGNGLIQPVLPRKSRWISR